MQRVISAVGFWDGHVGPISKEGQAHDSLMVLAKAFVGKEL